MPSDNNTEQTHSNPISPIHMPTSILTSSPTSSSVGPSISKYTTRPTIQDTLNAKRDLLECKTIEILDHTKDSPMYNELEVDIKHIMSQIHILEQSMEALNRSPPTVSKISYKDLPVFCLEGQTKPSNTTEVFKTAEAFLNRFERILVSYGANINKDWKRLLFCSMDGDAAIWYKDHISNKSLTWEDAKSLIINHFDAQDKRVKNALNVVSMKMGVNESVVDFGLRFQGAFRGAKWLDNEFMGVLCLKALTKPLQNAVLISLQGHKDHVDGVPSSSTTVLSIAKDIQGQKRAYDTEDDDQMPANKSRKKDNKSKYCSYHHKTNHTTEECRHLKTQKSMIPLVSKFQNNNYYNKNNSNNHTTTKANPCWYCKTPYTPDHNCEGLRLSRQRRREKASASNPSINYINTTTNTPSINNITIDNGSSSSATSTNNTNDDDELLQFDLLPSSQLEYHPGDITMDDVFADINRIASNEESYE
ncbi:unnamed protein product [Cunninghamella echinulata]